MDRDLLTFELYKQLLLKQLDDTPISDVFTFIPIPTCRSTGTLAAAKTIPNPENTSNVWSTKLQEKKT